MASLRNVRKLSNSLLRILIDSLAHLNVAILQAIRPFAIIRLNLWCTSSIGHMCSNTENTLAKLQLGIIPLSPRTVDAWFSRGAPANKALSKIQKRRFRRIYWPALYRTYELLNSKELKTFVLDHRNYLDDYDDVMARARPEVALSNKEFNHAQYLACQIGLEPQKPFVCFHIRDGMYDIEHHLDFKDPDDPRNHDCEAFVLAIQNLINRGIQVVRMGRSLRDPMPVSSAHFVDFALLEDPDPLLDIYLGAYCHFFVSTCSGLDEVARVFRRPLVCVNEPSWADLRREIPHSIHVLQNIRCTVTGTLVPQTTLHSRNLYGPKINESDPRLAGFTYVKSTPEDINNAVLEMLEWRNLGRHPLSNPQDLTRQRRFWSIHSKLQRPVDRRETRTIISPAFLVANTHWCQ
jgi:putative glycosyltransferase (TIGR04372 family)